MKKNLLILFVFVMQIVNAQTPIYEFNLNGNLSNSGSASLTTPFGTFSNLTYVTDRNGNANSAIDMMESTTNTVNITPATCPALPLGNAARTLNLWVKFTQTGLNDYYFMGWGNNVNNQAFGISQLGNNVRFYNWGTTNDVALSSPQNTTSWVMYTFVYTGTVAKHYINGQLISSVTKNINTTAGTLGNRLSFGKLANESAQTFNTLYMDDIKIYDVALTDAQVSNLYAPAILPVISNISASAVTTNSATINYSINSFGQNAERRVRYEFGITSPVLTTPVAFNSTTATPYTTNLTGLSQNRRYVAKVFAQVVGQADFEASPNIIFTTTGNLPVPIVSGVNVFNISSTSASLNYLFNPNGNSPSTANIQYAAGNTLTAINGAFEVTGTSNVSYTSNLTGLTPNTTYSYIIFGSNASGESQDITGTFTTLPSTPAPAITNLSTSNVTFNSATVNFNLNAFGSATTYVVEYSTDIIGNYTPVTPGGTTAANTSTPFTVQVSGLNPNTQYFVRVRATNAANQVTISNEVSFTTLNSIILTNVGISNVTATTAQINYTLNTNGFNAFVEIRYQASTVFDSDSPFTTEVISNFTTVNNAPTNYNYSLTGLTPNTTYSYQFGAVDQNSGGVETGENAAFTTLGISAQPTAPSPQTFCQSSNPTVANLSATGTNIKWYANATGGSALANATPLVSGTYYVTQTQANSVESSRLAVTVTINVTTAPTAQAQSFCNSATVANLVATGTNLKWYASQTGGSQLANSTALATGTYFVSQTVNGCESARSAVAVTINVTTAPTAQAQSFCNSATVANLVATGTNLKWYVAQTGGSQLANSTALATGTYYVSQTIGTCESTRTAVAVTINVTNAPTTQAQSFCNSATVANLTATGTNLKWYVAQTGGSQLANSTALATGTYYVSQTIGTCESTRTAVAVTINVTNAPTTQAQSFCNSATVANLTATGTNLKWYATLTGGTQLASTTALATGTYFVSQTIGTCESTRTSVSVTVNVVNAPVAQAQSFCNSATIGQLTATGSNLKWYDNITGGTQLPNSLTFVQTNTFYVSQTVGTCESLRTPVLATVNVVTAPIGNATQTFVQGATISNLVANGSSIVWYSTQANATANTNPLVATTLLVNNTTYYAMQTVNGCRSTTPLAVTVTVTLSNIDVNKLVFSMYPNPAKDRLTIEMETELQSVEIYTLQGQIVQTSTNKNVFLNNLPTGVYIIKVEDVEGLSNTKKLIIK